MFLSPVKKRCFYFLPKTVDSCSCGSWHHNHQRCMNPIENLRISDWWPFFFLKRHKIWEKDASISATAFFFFLRKPKLWLEIFFLLRKPKFWQESFAPLIENASRAALFSHWVQNFHTISGIYTGCEKLEGTLTNSQTFDKSYLICTTPKYTVVY